MYTISFKVLSLLVILMILLLSGCTDAKQNSQEEGQSSEGVKSIDTVESSQKSEELYKEVTGIAKFHTEVAIVTENTVLKNTYSILSEAQVDLERAYAVYYDKHGNPRYKYHDDTTLYGYYDVYGIPYYIVFGGEESSLPITKNDLVLVTGEKRDYYRVTFAHGDPPSPHGYISKNAISFDERLFVNANQGRIIDAMTYNSIEGRELGLQSGTGIVQRRENGWIQLAFLGGADNNFWIRGESLRFDLAHDVLDKVTE